MLSDLNESVRKELGDVGLNAPYGAPCFLTHHRRDSPDGGRARLNAPYGAPCFLTRCVAELCARSWWRVLMHPMALRAF